jgi:photosystem II stability/assembly factor-like uncharacterized protein
MHRRTCGLQWLALGCCAALFSTLRPAVAGVWVTNGPQDTSIYALALDPDDPDVVYTGSASGRVFTSTDGGDSWTLTSNGLPVGSSVRALVLDPLNANTIYAGLTGSGVYKTTNAGLNWGPANSGIVGVSVRALAINPLTPSTLYAGTATQGVYKTTNSGGSWSPVNNGLTSLNVNALAIHATMPNRVYAATNAGGVFKTANGGTGWAPINQGNLDTTLPTTVPANAIIVDANSLTQETGYAGTGGQGVHKAFLIPNWDPLNIGLANLDVRALALDPADANTLYAGTSGGTVFRLFAAKEGTDDSDDPNKNLNWSAIGNNLDGFDVTALAVHPADRQRVYAATVGGGVYALTPLCSSTPLAGCPQPAVANKAVLTVKDSINNKQDSLTWKWLKGASTLLSDFGDPLTTDAYSLCLYDESGNEPVLLVSATAPPGGTCGTKPCWKVKSTTGFQYKNAKRTADGIDAITLKAGASTKAQSTVVLKGLTFDTSGLFPTTPKQPLSLPLRVQLQAENGHCWEAIYSIATKNVAATGTKAGQFSAKAD